MKQLIKRTLLSVGLWNPAKGVKVSQEKKAEVLRRHLAPSMSDFVETGTHQGGMIEALGPYVKNIFSVEFDQELYQRAVERFRNDKNVYLYHGDSAKEIHLILNRIIKPALFWLDAHDAGDITFKNSPVLAEILAILNHPVRGHVVVIDDARHFRLRDIWAIRRIAHTYNYRLVIDDGLFRLLPL